MTIQQLFGLYRRLHAPAGDDGADGGGGNGGDAGAGDDKGGGGGDGKGSAPTGLLDAHAKGAGKEGAGGEGGGDGDDKGGDKGGAKTRPEYVLEQHWDPTKGEVRTEAMAKSLADTQKAFRELQAKGGHKPPEKASDYKLELPKDVKLHASLSEVDTANDPGFKLFNDLAHKAGLSQQQYNLIAGGFLQGASPFMPEPIDLVAEKAKIGKNADEAIGAVHAWGKTLVERGLWNEEEFSEIVHMGSTAVGIKALLKLRAEMGEKPIPLDGAVQEGLPSKEELYERVASAEYQNNESYRKETDVLFAKVFGTQAAGTSPAGLGVGAGSRAPGFEAGKKKT